MSQKLNAAIAVIGIDIGKNSFSSKLRHCSMRSALRILANNGLMHRNNQRILSTTS